MIMCERVLKMQEFNRKDRKFLLIAEVELFEFFHEQPLLARKEVLKFKAQDNFQVEITSYALVTFLNQKLI